MARIEDIEGVEAIEEDVAKGLGFVSIEAFREWRRQKEKSQDDQIQWMLAEICNLKARADSLERVSSLNVF